MLVPSSWTSRQARFRITRPPEGTRNSAFLRTSCTADHLPSYDNVVYFLIAMKAIDVFYGFGYHFLDKNCFGGVLRQNEAQQRAAEADEAETGRRRPAPLRKAVKSVTYIGMALLSILVVIAWVLYLVYSQAK